MEKEERIVAALPLEVEDEQVRLFEMTGTTEMYMGTKTIKATPATKIIDDSVGYRVQYADGYESWSPKKVFDETYRSNGELSFSHVLEAVRKGKDAQRSGWNGSELRITLIPAGNASWRGHDMQDCLALMKPNGEIQPGWVPSQGDMLTSDWTIL